MSYVRMSDLAQVDYGRLQIWGRSGCFIGFDSSGRPMFTTSTDGRGFRPMPIDKIAEARNRISQLQGTIERKGTQVEAYGRKALAGFSEYLGTNIEVCKAPGYAESAFATVTFGAFSSVGASGYQACLGKRAALQQSIVDATRNFTLMGDTRADLYADYQEIMQYAPSQEAWTTLCGKKFVAEDRFTSLSNEVQTLATKALEKLKTEEKDQAAETSKIDLLIKLFEDFIAALKLMIEALEKVFQEIIKGIAVAVGFLAKYPDAILWGAAGVAGVGALAGAGYLWFKYRQVKQVIGS